ncbi:Alpha/Beta hydrolase protein [Xylariaceae sp. FL0804]|nr:Alpha/Beta hydrolase protein [Xylariaceae sp. FL0804]
MSEDAPTKAAEPIPPPSGGGQRSSLPPGAEDLCPDPRTLAKYKPEIVEYLLRAKAAGVPAANEVPIEEVRANPARFAPPWARDVTGHERVADDAVTSADGACVPVKIYTPDPERFGAGPYAAHLNFHGGGFVLGDLTTESQICQSMCDGAGVVVVDVNYRHCPETVWGKCIQDAWAALNWVRDSAAALNVKPDSVSIGGISAGGQIAIVLQHMARDAGVPLKLCMATVPPASPGLTYDDWTESPHASMHEFALGPVLGWDRMGYFGRQCFPPDRREEIRAMWPKWWVGPLDAENWRGLCPTYIRTGECDALRDEGEAYARRLVEGGTRVTLKRYLGCPHLFMFFAWLEEKRQWDRDSIAALREAHSAYAH